MIDYATIWRRAIANETYVNTFKFSYLAVQIFQKWSLNLFYTTQQW